MAALGRLIVMLAAEGVGCSKLIQGEREGTLKQLRIHRDQLVYPKIKEHYGRIIRAASDSLLVEFDSPIEAVTCAVELQSGVTDSNIGASPDRWISLRVGVDMGEAKTGGDDLVSRAVAALPADTLATLIKPGTALYGDTGNMAMRLAALADPAGICISGAVRDAIRNHLPYVFEDIGRRNLDIRATPVHCYTMSTTSLAPGPRFAGQGSQSRPVRLRSAAVAVSVLATVSVWGVALWAWLGANASRAPIPAVVTIGSHLPFVGNTVDGAALTGSATKIPHASNTVADRDAQAPSSQPILFETGAAVGKARQVSVLQTTPDGGAAALGLIQAPSVSQSTPDAGGAVDRITGTYWSQLLRSKSEWHQTRRRSAEPARPAAEGLSRQ